MKEEFEDTKGVIKRSEVEESSTAASAITINVYIKQLKNIA
jgi:hypothetical protein